MICLYIDSWVYSNGVAAHNYDDMLDFYFSELEMMTASRNNAFRLVLAQRSAIREAERPAKRERRVQLRPNNPEIA
jgi:hypothetical protein